MAKSKSPSKGLERRRFERVALNLDWGKAKPILGAKIMWPNGESGEVLDMSYQGLAGMRPALYEIKVSQKVQVHMDLPGEQSANLVGRVVWFNDTMVGLEFSPLDLDTRALIDEFLEDRLVGLHLRSIDRRYFKEGESFSHWYHGPKETNIYLWISVKGDLERAIIEMEGQSLVYENGELLGAGLNVSSVDSDLKVEMPNSSPMVKRAREVLSQLKEQQKPLRHLLEVLGGAE